MEIGERLVVHSLAGWRAWLENHHQEKKEIWLVLYKSTSANRTVTMRDAQEEALCFGWVDSSLKPLDGESYVLRFSPRSPKSAWGPANKARALRMLRAGKMAPAGLALLPVDVLQAWRGENRVES
jgi:uncharacterized protein YdeI (YjbR/CyaY-like superfamily)